MFIFTYSAVILTTICVGIAAFLFLKAERDARTLFLTGYAAAAALWIASNSMADVMVAPEPLIFWSGMAMIGASFSVSLYLCFVYSLIHGRSPSFPRLLIYFLPAAILSLGAFSKYSVAETFFPPGAPTQITPGIFYQYLTYFIYGSLIYGSVTLAIFSKRMATPIQRLQVLYVLLGFYLLFGGMLLFALILPILGEYRFFTLGTQFSLFFIGFSTYAVVKHRLLDIKVVIQRGFLYTLLLILIIGAYLAILYSSLFFTKSLTRDSYLFASLMTTVAGIMAVPWIKRRFEKITDHIFFKNRYVFSEAVDELSQVLNKNLDPLQLEKETSDALARIFRVKLAKIHIFDREVDQHAGDPVAHDDSENSMARKLEKKVPSEMKSLLFKCEDYEHHLDELKDPAALDALIIIPAILHEELVGLICLGRKLSGDPYFADDIALLRSFSFQAAVAIEKARLYRKVQEHSRQLEAKVKERTAELHELQESQAEMMINISHYLQTPLTIIKGQFGAIKNACGDTKELATFERSIDKISEFITRLLRLTALNNGETMSRKDPIDLSKLIRDIIDYFAIMAEQQKITLRIDIADGVLVRGDGPQLDELIVNLLSNAVKFISGEKIITISLEKKNEAAMLTISDSGIGIAETDLPKLFTRFHRAPDAKVVSGSGLGLSISKKIVELHGGTIAITSAPGKGTTVHVNLPAVS